MTCLWQGKHKELCLTWFNLKKSVKENRQVNIIYVLEHLFLSNYNCVIHWFVCYLKSIERSLQEFGSVTDPMVHSKRESLVHRYWQEENEHTKNRAFLSYRWIKKPKFNHVYVLFKHPNFCSRMLEMHSMRPTSRNKAINKKLI